MKKYVEDLDFQGEEYVSDWTPWSPQDIRRKKGVLEAARLMLNSAMTAPLAGGVPSVEGHLVYGQEELEAVAERLKSWPIKIKPGQKPFFTKRSWCVIRMSSYLSATRAVMKHRLMPDAGFAAAVWTAVIFTKRKPTSMDWLIIRTDLHPE